jgi:hypothetical protein
MKLEGRMNMWWKMSIISKTSVVATAVALVMGLCTTILAEDKPASEKKAVGDAYPLDYCLVSGKQLGSMGEPVQYVHEGREIKFCCSGCIDDFKKNAATYLGRLDSIIVEQQLPYYPLTTCLVGGQDLSKAREPVNLVYNNRLVRLHSAKGIARFTKDPATYLATLDSAVVAGQLPGYPLKTCVISGMQLGGMGEPVNYVHGNRLVRFCCGGCIDAFRADPTAGLAKIDAALAPEEKAADAPAGKKDQSDDEGGKR